MEGELNEGSVPLYYREVHQAVSSRTDERVSIDVFQRLLNRTDLSVSVQNKITEHVDNGDGFLSKVSLYKALALIALAQQGKQPSPKLLENCIQEFPKPQLGDPKELQALRIQPAQDNPLLMSLSLASLLGKDTIKMELIPEKKGLFLKHVEYQVTSERFKISVYRRYSDFDVFHELLLQRYAYRMVPALPPKRMLKGVLNSMSEREFIEGRRRGLGRFLNLVARHPFFSEDELVKIFLTFNGSDVQTKLRDAFKKMGDEFMTYTYATQAKEYLPPDIQALFTTCRELIRNIHNSFQKLRDRAERMAERSKENSTDLLMFGKELSTLGCDPSPLPTLDSSKSMWADLRLSLRGLSSEFSLLSDKAAQQGRREEDDVVEKLNFFLDLLQSYRDLCERHEKGVLHEHQKVLQKYSVMKRQMMSAAVQPKEQVSVEQLESRIIQLLLSPHCDSFMKFAAQAGSHFEWFMKNPTVLVKAFSGDVVKFVREKQENAIQTMELRNYFSLFCVHQESQLIFAYLPITSHILGAFVNSQVQSHREMGQVWNNLHSKLSGLFAACNGCQSPPLTPK